MARSSGQVVFITGASSGIGAACARAFAAEGARLLLVARRLERLREQESDLRRRGAADVRSARLDVRDEPAVRRFVAELPEPWPAIGVLVNNAGLSRGLDPLHEGKLDDWNEMIDTNVKGLLHVNRTVVPLMVRRGSGTVIHIGSIAGEQTYAGGNVYCATKHAVRALVDGLRIDLLGTGVRVCSVDPGLVETEFSHVRFRGDERRAAATYRDLTPLTADDVAEVVRFAATCPPHVCLARCLVLPTDQASASLLNRKS